ncbi:hypothetical protein BDV25DRAFT_159902 [Aspergillus avenaceus]|uniref:Protein PXR1 n=1 Tax=Aspergillus avenaceus TaxID=36643 RepID=A0A5N6TMY8_ASPAV|nr:hypothetical protein BDV25DRAFT_159902 [Aspergillus avenaceus]
MGLAAPRKKTKISQDPNNTNWSRSTSGFGHKILSSQGWTPGTFLGARDAAHADMFTAASASHIRVSIKDDTLGLGARAKRDAMDEPTGLDAFKGLLGRLNGKSDAVLAAEQRKREDVKVARYIATKWQTINFVSGGLLAQEKNVSQPEKDKDTNHAPENKPEEPFTDDNISPTQPCENHASSDVQQIEERRHKKDKREKKDRSEKKDKKNKPSKKRKLVDESDVADSDSVDKKTTDAYSKFSAGEARQGTLPSNTTLSKERRPMGRHVFRSRHIAQKKKALLDDKSLNEIFMVKS